MSNTGKVVSEGKWVDEKIQRLERALEVARNGLAEAATQKNRDNVNGYAGEVAAKTLAEIEAIVKGE